MRGAAGPGLASSLLQDQLLLWADSPRPGPGRGRKRHPARPWHPGPSEPLPQPAHFAASGDQAPLFPGAACPGESPASARRCGRAQEVGAVQPAPSVARPSQQQRGHRCAQDGRRGRTCPPAQSWFQGWFLGRSPTGRSEARCSAQGRIQPMLRAYSGRAGWFLPPVLRASSHQC